MKMMSKCEKKPWCVNESCEGVPPPYFAAPFMPGAGRHHPGMWCMPPPAYQPQFFAPMMTYGGPGFNQFEGDMPTPSHRRPWFYPSGIYPSDPKMWKKFRKHCKLIFFNKYALRKSK
jgi:hypothetical protein